MTVEGLKREIERIDLIIKPLLDQKKALEKCILEINSQFKIGDIIEWNNAERRGRIVEIQRWGVSDDNPMWGVIVIRKDGSIGSRVTVRSYNNPKLSNCQTICL